MSKLALVLAVSFISSLAYGMEKEEEKDTSPRHPCRPWVLMARAAASNRNETVNQARLSVILERARKAGCEEVSGTINSQAAPYYERLGAAVNCPLIAHLVSVGGMIIMTHSKTASCTYRYILPEKK
jgi:hypothetical protein